MDVFNQVFLPPYHTQNRWERIIIYFMGAEILEIREKLGVGWYDENDKKEGYDPYSIYGRQGKIAGWTIQNVNLGGTSGLRLLRYARQKYGFEYEISEFHWISKQGSKTTSLYSIDLQKMAQRFSRLYQETIKLNSLAKARQTAKIGVTNEFSF